MIGVIQQNTSLWAGYLTLAIATAYWVGKSAVRRGRNPILFGGIALLLTGLFFLLGMGTSYLVLWSYPPRDNTNEMSAMRFKNHAMAIGSVILCFVIGGSALYWVRASLDGPPVQFPLADAQRILLPPNPDFRPLRLDHGFEIEVPTYLVPVSAEASNNAATVARRAADVAGVTPSAGTKNLYRANSTSPLRYSVSVAATIPPTASEDEIRAMRAADMRQVDEELRQTLPKMMSQVGATVIRIFESSTDTIGGHAAIITRIVRSGPDGNVEAESWQIFTKTAQFRVDVSWPEAASQSARPVIARIRKSIWCSAP